ncbi:MAG TPA: sulfur oxidation c-type cytochrome SoxX [Burkholderiaceae bacterium]|nr:sulfur oxidation c-type cytochrome SoxX [Burkholderiaceae bacterium]
MSLNIRLANSFKKQTTIFALIAAAGLAAGLSGCASHEGPSDIDALADKVHKASFEAGPGQDLSRLVQDQTQIDCSLSKAKPNEKLAAVIQAREAKNIVYPADGKLMGDWKAGAKIFNGGFAYRIGSFIPNKPDAVRGGNCYACHQGEAKEAAFGNIGPSLLHYGKLRGQSEIVVKTAYNKIYNAKATNACSAMPRLGHNKILSPAQVADLTAYLVSPESPINK